MKCRAYPFISVGADEMLLKVLTHLAFLLTACIGAQKIPVEPVPEPTEIYTCDKNYQPVDLAFDENGVLYTTDAQLLFGGGMFQYVQGTRSEVQLKNYLYRHDGRKCQMVLETPSQNLFGLAATPSGEVCFARNEGDRRTGPITLGIYCIAATGEIRLALSDSSLSSDVTDITFHNGDLFLISILETPTQDMPTEISRLPFPVGEAIIVKLARISEPVSFFTLSKDGTTFMSLLPHFASKIIDGQGREVLLPTLVELSDIQQHIFVSTDNAMDFPEDSKFAFPSGVYNYWQFFVYC
jgi:hypothetical protein